MYLLARVNQSHLHSWCSDAIYLWFSDPSVKSWQVCARHGQAPTAGLIPRTTTDTGKDRRVETIGTFDIFKIGVGPSSSHTMGPWRAAQQFVKRCRSVGVFEAVVRVQVDLYGSLAKTGRGHGTDIAVLLGLSNVDPVTCDAAQLHSQVAAILASGTIELGATSQSRFRQRAT